MPSRITSRSTNGGKRNGERHWLYGTVDPGTKRIPGYSPVSDHKYATNRTQFLRELTQKVPTTRAVVLVDDARHRKAAVCRLDLGFQTRRRGNRTVFKHISKNTK